MTAVLAQTPLHDWHAAHGGRMVDFAGWMMPVQYTSIVAEHNATRSAAGLFDISHMGRLRLDGPGALPFLEALLTRRMRDLKPGRIRYSLVTNESGGILDDILVYHLLDAAGGSYVLVVVNASNRLKIVDWFQRHLSAARDVQLSDATDAWSMIAVQGPRALDLAQRLIDVSLAPMKYYTGLECRIAGGGGIVSRTGYTGEDGCELIVGAGTAERVWQTLIDDGATACGLGCRDTLRLEAAMPLYGHELTEQTNPLEAGLDFAVDLPDRGFPGHDVLAAVQAAGVSRRRVGLELAGKRVPREGYRIIADGAAVGEVTSGTFSPTFERPIAMGYVKPEFAGVGRELNIDVRGRAEPARVVELPFYRRPS